MTVKEFIDFLRNQPQDLEVAYGLYSESALLDIEDIRIADACYPRSDGWVANKRPDKPTKKYLILPGN